jgi:hypothetical protein
VRRAQPGQSDRDESADCGFGRQAASCGEGIETVIRELLGRDIVSDVAGLCALGQQVSDDVREVLLRLGDMLIPMQECREFALAAHLALAVGWIGAVAAYLALDVAAATS